MDDNDRIFYHPFCSTSTHILLRSMILRTLCDPQDSRTFCPAAGAGAAGAAAGAGFGAGAAAGGAAGAALGASCFGSASLGAAAGAGAVLCFWFWGERRAGGQSRARKGVNGGIAFFGYQTTARGSILCFIIYSRHVSEACGR